MQNAGAGEYFGWAFGMGLERIAMAKYEISDIRTFWCEDERFLNQFADAAPDTKIIYKPISMQPPVYNDMSFWIPKDYVETDFFDIVRQIGGDIVESIVLKDKYIKDGLISLCYRFTYRSPTHSLTQREVSMIHEEIRQTVQNDLGVQHRV